MAGLQDLDVVVDSQQLVDDAAAWGESQQAGWALSAGHLETILLEGVARIASVLAVLAQSHSRDIFRDFIATILRVPSLEATSATGTLVFTFIDTAGHTVPAGTEVVIADQAFQTATAATAAPGVATASCTIVAVIPGAAGGGVSGTVQVVDQLTAVDHATLTGSTTGGSDGETTDEYVDRVHDELPTLSLAAITPRDMELLAARVDPVDLALAIDLYVPAGPGGSPPAQTNVPGAITVAVRDTAGEPVGTTPKAAVTALLEQRRLMNLAIYVIDPTYTVIDVTFAVRAYPGWDAASVRADAINALQGFLAPANWGLPSAGEVRRWGDEPVVKQHDLIVILGRVQGIRHVDDVNLGVGGGSQTAADVTLTGPAALTRPGLIAGTVT